MSQFRRDYFELKRAEAVDISDPRSFAVNRKTSLLNRPEYRRPRKAFCSLHSNRNCCECKKKKAVTQKRRKQRTLGMDLLVNDYHGFNWIDTKVNEFQTLNVAGKGIKTSPDIFHNDGVFQNNRLFFPELSLNRPLLVTEQAGIYRKQPRARKGNLGRLEDHGCSRQELSRKKDSLGNKDCFMPVLHPLPSERKVNLKTFENKERFSLLHVVPGESLDTFEDEARLPVLDQRGSFNNEVKVLECTDKEKRRINVVLPRIA